MVRLPSTRVVSRSQKAYIYFLWKDKKASS